MTRRKKLAARRLTRMHHRLERQVAYLDVEGELVNLHPAGADQHLVLLNPDQAVAVDAEVGTRGGFVLFCPVW